MSRRQPPRLLPLHLGARESRPIGSPTAVRRWIHRWRQQPVQVCLLALLALVAVALLAKPTDGDRSIQEPQPTQVQWDEISVKEGVESQDECDFSLRIAVFAFKRPAQFREMWASLRAAAGTVTCISTVDVFHDFDESDSEEWRTQRQILTSLKPISTAMLRVHYAHRRIGLRESILNSWMPDESDREEFCLFLEDDVVLSPLALRYTESAIRRYFLSQNLYDERLFGLSLYSPIYDDVRGVFLSDTERATTHPYVYQYPSSWGAVYTAHAWRRLHSFVDEWHRGPLAGEPPYIPASLTNAWPSSASWKMFMLRLLVSDGAFMLYPRDGLSLSRNAGVTGENLSPDDVEWFLTHYEVPLVTQANAMAALELDDWLSDLTVFDVFRERLAGGTADLLAPHRTSGPAAFTSVILAIDADEANAVMRAALAHYAQQLPRVAAIVVLFAEDHRQPRACADPDRANVDVGPIPAEARVLICYYDAQNPLNKYSVLVNAVGASSAYPLVIVSDHGFVRPEHIEVALDQWRTGAHGHALTLASEMAHLTLRPSDLSWATVDRDLSVPPADQGSGGAVHHFIPLDDVTIIGARVLSAALARVSDTLRGAVSKSPFFAHLLVHAAAARNAAHRRTLAVPCGLDSVTPGAVRLAEPLCDVAAFFDLLRREMGANSLFVPSAAWLGKCAKDVQQA